MTLEGWLTLGLTALGFGLFLWNRYRPDVVALVLAATLAVTGLVTPAEAVSGFSNEATIAVALLLVLSTGLSHTGAVEVIARHTVRLAGRSEMRLLLLVVLVVVPLSAFVNNTAAVAILLPAVLGASRQVDVAPSRVLMPLSFASQFGGTLTLIGTSTNLLVAGLVLDLGFERIRIFEVTAPALVVTAAGLLYLLTVGRWLVPTREGSRDLLSSYELHEYLTTVRIRPGSSLAGRTIAESRFGIERDLLVVRVESEDGRVVAAPGASTLLREGDLVLVEGKVREIAAMLEAEGLDIQGADPSLPDPAESEEREEDAVRFAELLVPTRSPAIGRTLRELRLRTRYAASILGLRRHGEAVRENLGDVRLRPGDILLGQGRASALHELHESGRLTLVGPVDIPPRRRRKLWWAVLAMALTVGLAALGVLPIMISAMVGVVLLLLTRTVRPEEAYEEMDWMVVVLLAAIIPLGIALQKSGAATQLALWIATLAGPLGPYGLLAAVYVLTSILTNVVSNVAAAAIVLPVAGALATAAGLSPTPFA
ncbi:MAG: SLC13 family permease, partial [Gemmatimonadota bacterium]